MRVSFKYMEEGFNIHKIPVPTAILIGALIIGGFYYASEASKQGSIERQQQAELQAKADSEQAQRDAEAQVRLGKMFCADEASASAEEQYKKTCTYNCIEGYHYIKDYDNYYAACLQRKGLD